MPSKRPTYLLSLKYEINDMSYSGKQIRLKHFYIPSTHFYLNNDFKLWVPVRVCVEKFHDRLMLIHFSHPLLLNKILNRPSPNGVFLYKNQSAPEYANYTGYFTANKAIIRT